MLRAVVLKMPAWPLALMLSGALLLSGCGLLPARAPEVTGVQPVGGVGERNKDARDAFTVEIEAPREVRDYLQTHLEIQRYRELDDLGAVELSRLVVAAEANARELLATLGYFTPTLTLTLEETPDRAAAPRNVRIQVDPGEPTRIDKVDIDFNGAIAQDPAAEAQRRAIRAQWRLPPGQVFTQEGWDNAKSTSLRSLAARRYPTASIARSRAAIDADTRRAQLDVAYASGPAYRFGPLEVRGSERYSSDGARRLAQIPTGEDYDQQKLLDAQQRLASSGYYDSVFLTLDTEAGNPQFAPVIAQVREAPLQKLVAGIGFTSDSGLRVSLDHTHNQLPLLEWRAVSRFLYDRNDRLLGTDWNGLPADNGWRWFTGGQLQRQTNAGSYTVDSARLRLGRNKSSGPIDRSLFVQYEATRNFGIDPPPSAGAFSLNWGWTGRYFDNPGTPTHGQGLALELGAGLTTIGPRLPYLRSYARWLGVVPLGPADSPETAARRSRLALRAEAGGVFAKDAAQIPSTQLFLTGGDTTVRGYSYRQIGVTTNLNQIAAGRYLGVASVEWQRPLVLDGKLSDWESVVFVDAGAVADQPRGLHPKVGVGVGARWRSPVGPVQADLAYGVDVKAFRLHLRLGFTF